MNIFNSHEYINKYIKVNSSGFVGINTIAKPGTTNPTFNLEVIGTGRFSSNLDIDGGTINTTSSTFNLLNHTATTMNFAGVASTFNLGIVSGTNASTTNFVSGAISSDTKEINIGTSGVNGSTTNITIGTSSNGAQNVTIAGSTRANTIDIGTGATESTFTKTVNLGTNGASGSTSNINIGTGNASGSTSNINIGNVLGVSNVNISTSNNTSTKTINIGTGQTSATLNTLITIGTPTDYGSNTGSAVLNLNAQTTIRSSKNAQDALRINQIDTAVSTNIVQLQSNSTERFSVKSNGDVFINQLGRTSTYTVTTTTTSAVALTLGATAQIRSLDVMIQATRGSDYQLSKMLVIHNGTNIDWNEYGMIETNTFIGNYTFTISGGNINISITSISATSSVYRLFVNALFV
jgi:hypothetical protein